ENLNRSRRFKMKHVLILAGLIGGVFFPGCTRNENPNAVTENRGENAFTAVADLQAKSGSKVSGTVAFNLKPEGLVVTARVENATPGKHGFHIHEKGDCSAADGSSAGGHYNPTDKSHGGPSAASHHVGDMGNITVNADGTGSLKETLKTENFSDWEDLIGRAVVLHGGTDDLVSQPSGNAGDRVACGVIQKGPLETSNASE
ncbi:MAG: superoxide dismutase family protein, partial [Bdellovibrionota bacterium]